MNPKPATALNVQIFGLKNSSATRAAERFFKERRIPIHYVDRKLKPMSAGEIGRFVKKFGLPALLDKEGKAYTEAGLQHMIISEAGWLGKIETNPQLLKLPMVRCGNHLAIGADEAGWKAMLA
jgi:arsenate reductase (glutaredoxin)